MTIKEKIILVFLSIISLGIYPIIIFNKKNIETKTELSSTKKVTVNIEKLHNLLGGKENIVGSEFTHTKVKIFIKLKNNINLEAIKELKGISGVFATSKAISIIVGNQAKELAHML